MSPSHCISGATQQHGGVLRALSLRWYDRSEAELSKAMHGLHSTQFHIHVHVTLPHRLHLAPAPSASPRQAAQLLHRLDFNRRQ